MRQGAPGFGFDQLGLNEGDGFGEVLIPKLAEGGLSGGVGPARDSVESKLSSSSGYRVEVLGRGGKSGDFEWRFCYLRSSIHMFTLSTLR